MAKCTECGASVGDDLKFCGYCGARLDVISEHIGAKILRDTGSILQALSTMAPTRRYTVLGTVTEGPDAGGAVLTTPERDWIFRTPGGEIGGFSFLWSNGEKTQEIPWGLVDEYFEGGILRWSPDLMDTCPHCSRSYHRTRGLAFLHRLGFESTVDHPNLPPELVNKGSIGTQFPIHHPDAVQWNANHRAEGPVGGQYFPTRSIHELVRAPIREDHVSREHPCPLCAIDFIGSPVFSTRRRAYFDARLQELSLALHEQAAWAKLDLKKAPNWSVYYENRSARKKQARELEEGLVVFAGEVLPYLSNQLDRYMAAEAAAFRTFSGSIPPVLDQPITSRAEWLEYQERLHRFVTSIAVWVMSPGKEPCIVAPTPMCRDEQVRAFLKSRLGGQPWPPGD